MLAEEIAKVEAAGLPPHTKLHLRRGAGAYICGEELAMIESIEGKRGLPRHRPPYVAQVGLFGRPTLEQNVETLYWVRDIVEKGAAWMTGKAAASAKACAVSRSPAASRIQAWCWRPPASPRAN